MPITVTGFPGAYGQPRHYGRNEQGNYTVIAFEGTQFEVANVAASYAQQLGLAYNVTETYGGKSRLEVQIPWNITGIDPRTDAVINWEFFAEHGEEDLLSAKSELPTTIGQLSDAQVDDIRNFLLNPPQRGDAAVALKDFQTAGESAPSAQNALNIYNLMKRGVRNYPIEAPRLRRTLITSNQYGPILSLAFTRKILSTTTLTNLWSLPAALLFSLPLDVSNDPGFAYGWYQFFPTIQQVARLKWQITSEWQYGLWATLIWGTPL